LTGVESEDFIDFEGNHVSVDDDFSVYDYFSRADEVYEKV